MKARWFWVLLLMVIPVGRAGAAALAALDFSTTAMGVGNAFVATADDPSAVHYNPAGIAWQPGVGVMFNGMLRFEDMSAGLNSSQGTPFNTQSPTNIGSIYAAWMPLDGKLGLGAGLDLPFSTNTGWGSAFGGKALRTSLNTYHLSVDVVYALNSDMAVAVGPDWYVGRIDVDSAATVFHGTDATGVGLHAAWMWRPRPAWSVGLTFRTGATLDLAGKAAGALNGNARVNVPLPDVLQVGVAHVFADRLRVELDGSWTRWSTFKDLDVIGNGGTGAVLNPLDLRDSLSAILGVTWFWREDAQLRFGYAFDAAATRKAGFNARIVDADVHRFSLGAGAALMNMHIDAAYTYVYAPARVVSGSTGFDGRYKLRRQVLSMALTKAF